MDRSANDECSGPGPDTVRWRVSSWANLEAHVVAKFRVMGFFRITADYGYRCNNVLWIQGANQNNGNGDTKMEG